jgi:NAD(P)-dependent dehydrogenase (short-subunit alcohol dehydrogenase family)
MRLDGRRILITGGANGLGAATATLFAANGASVVVADLAAMADRTALPFVGIDVRDATSVRAGVDRAADMMGGIDGVVTYAGVAIDPRNPNPSANLLVIDIDHYDFVQQVNVRGVLLTCQRAAHLMVAAKSPGTLVNIGSIASRRPTAGAYSVSKAAVWMLTRCLAVELGQHQIRVNAIGPGYVDTELFNAMGVAAVGDDPNDQAMWKDGRRAQVTLGRFGTPDDIARTAMFLTSDDSAYFTGSMLHPDGGYVSMFGGG